MSESDKKMLRAKVLLVDDEEDFTEVLSMRLESRGMVVDVASNGPAALNKIDEKSFDAVILDLAMPGMDGIETLTRMRAKNQDIQVILLTGRATVEKGILAVKSGAAEFLEKPADIDLLVEKVREAQEKKGFLVEKRAEESVSKIMRNKGW